MSTQLAGTASPGVRSLVSGPRRRGRVFAAGYTSGADLAWGLAAGCAAVLALPA